MTAKGYFMTLQEKFDAVLFLLKSHNDVIGVNNPGFVDPDKFIANIKAIGGTNEEVLKGFSYEDIITCLPTSSLKPVPLAKAVAKVFRDKEEEKYVSSKKADKMTLRELVDSFDPEDCTNSVANRLGKISKSEPFVVFSSGRLVDAETTFKIIQEIKSGYSGRNDIDVNGVTKKVYKIGEYPDHFADENPLYKGRALRPDGTCDQTGRSWDGVGIEVRQFVRLALETGELAVNIETAHSILDIVVGSDALVKLRKRYRKSSTKFDELAQIGNLPKLKITLKKDTFLEGKKVCLK